MEAGCIFDWVTHLSPCHYLQLHNSYCTVKWCLFAIGMVVIVVDDVVCTVNAKNKMLKQTCFVHVIKYCLKSHHLHNGI